MPYAAILYLTTLFNIYTQPLHPVALFLSGIYEIPTGADQKIAKLINMCLAENPSHRPSAEYLNIYANKYFVERLVPGQITPMRSLGGSARIIMRKPRPSISAIMSRNKNKLVIL